MKEGIAGVNLNKAASSAKVTHVMVVGDLAAERREVRGGLRSEEPVEERTLVRALLGPVGHLELGPVGLVHALVLEAREHQDAKLARAWDEIDRLDRIATAGGLRGRLSALRLKREQARIEKRDRAQDLGRLLVARDRRRSWLGDRSQCQDSRPRALRLARVRRPKLLHRMQRSR